jgi:hypothetical protein
MGVPGFANSQASLPTAAISAMLMLLCLLCLAILFARIRAREVVRG